MPSDFYNGPSFFMNAALFLIIVADVALTGLLAWREHNQDPIDHIGRDGTYAFVLHKLKGGYYRLCQRDQVFVFRVMFIYLFLYYRPFKISA